MYNKNELMNNEAFLAEATDFEMDETMLDEVDGGFLFSWFKKCWKKESKRYTKFLNDL